MNESDGTATQANDDYVLVNEQNKQSPDSEPLIVPDITSIPENLLSQFCDRLARLQLMLKSLTTCSYSDELQGTFDSFLSCTTTSAVFSASKKKISTLFVKLPEKYEPLTEEFMNHIITKNSTDFGLCEICSGFEMLHSKTQSKLAKSLTKRLYRIFLDFLELDFRTLVEFSSVKTRKSSVISSDKHRVIALNMLLMAEQRYRSMNAEYKTIESRHSTNTEKLKRQALDLNRQKELLIEEIKDSKRTLHRLELDITHARVELQRSKRATSETLYRPPPKFDPPTLSRAFNHPLEYTNSEKELPQDTKSEQSSSLKEDHAAKTQSGSTMLERGDPWTIRNNSNCSDLKGSDSSVKDGETPFDYSARRPFGTKSLRPGSRTSEVSDAYKAIGAEIKSFAEDPRLDHKLQRLYRDIGWNCDRLWREFTANPKLFTDAESFSQIDHSILLDLHSMIRKVEDMLGKQH